MTRELASVAPTIFLFEDRDIFREKVTAALTSSGYKVYAVSSEETALRVIDNEPKSANSPWPLAVLDVIDDRGSSEAGFQIFERFNERWPNMPVVFLTDHANGGEANVRAFDKGIQWFIHKGSDPDFRMLLAIVRRTTARRPDPRYQVGRYLRVDLVQQQIEWRGTVLELSPAEFRVLEAMANEAYASTKRKQPGRGLSSMDIAAAAGINQVSGRTVAVRDRDSIEGKAIRQSLAFHIRNLRLLLVDREEAARASGEPAPHFLLETDLIVTEHGHGYRWAQV